MNIRRYNASDRPQLLNLWSEAFPDPAHHNLPATMLDAKLAIDDLVFVAEFDEKILGAAIAGYDGHRGWLYAVAVRSSARRQGIGTALIKESTAALRALCCSKINLQIRADNADIVAFYESLGFAQEPRISMGKLLEG